LTAHAPHFHKAVRPKRPRASPSRMSRHGWCDVLLDPPATPASTFSASSQHQDGRSPSAQHLHSLNLHRCLGTVQRPSLKSLHRPRDLVHLRMPVLSLLIATAVSRKLFVACLPCFCPSTSPCFPTNTPPTSNIPQRDGLPTLYSPQDVPSGCIRPAPSPLWLGPGTLTRLVHLCLLINA
jgi:hypothetical protein